MIAPGPAASRRASACVNRRPRGDIRNRGRGSSGGVAASMAAAITSAAQHQAGATAGRRVVDLAMPADAMLADVAVSSRQRPPAKASPARL